MGSLNHKGPPFGDPLLRCDDLFLDNEEGRRSAKFRTTTISHLGNTSSLKG